MACLPRLQRCCCCVPLEVCGYILALIAVFCAPVLLAGAVLELMNPVQDDPLATAEEAAEAAEAWAFDVAHASAEIGEALVSAALAVLFAVGIYKRRPSMVKPFVVWLYINLVFMVIVGVYAMFIDLLAAVLYLGLGASLQFYSLLCANSLYHIMVEEETSKPAKPRSARLA